MPLGVVCRRWPRLVLGMRTAVADTAVPRVHGVIVMLRVRRMRAAVLVRGRIVLARRMHGRGARCRARREIRARKQPDDTRRRARS